MCGGGKNAMQTESFEWAESDPVRWCEEILTRGDLVFSDRDTETGFFSPNGRRERALGLAAALLDAEETDAETWNRWQVLQSLWTETEMGARSRVTSERVVCEPGMTSSELVRQIQVDVERSAAFFDRHRNLDENMRAEKRARLTLVIQETMAACDEKQVIGVELQYLQGAHELCLVLMEVAGDETPLHQLVSMCQSVFMTRVFVLHSSLSLAVAVHMILTQVSLLIKQFAPE